MNQGSVFKIVVLGEGRVGKTSLTLRYCKDQFDEKQESTINASYLERVVNLQNGEQKKLAIWDTAGQEKFNALAPLYYKDAMGAVIVYDITYKESFNRVQKWAQELQQHGDKIVIAIAGNKSDKENDRQIKKEDAEKYALSLGGMHFSTSAKANVGVDEIFKYITNKIIEQQKKAKQPKKKKNNLILQEENFDENQEDPNMNKSTNIKIRTDSVKPKQKQKDGGCC